MIDYEWLVQGMWQLVASKGGDTHKLEAQIEVMKKVCESIIS